MKILCKTSNNRKMQGGQYVNKVGRYLYEHLDGAFKVDKSPNMYDIWLTLLYQIPSEYLTESEKEDVDVQELTINLNVTTYDDKLRVNIIVEDEYEKTIGTKTFSFAKLDNLEWLRLEILKFIRKKLEKEYEDYDFYF